MPDAHAVYPEGIDRDGERVRNSILYSVDRYSDDGAYVRNAN